VHTIDSSYDIYDGVNGTYLMEMDLLGRAVMDFALDLCE
jgi:hypothetical protein